jgi:uncharacterized RDD family membrane protein YckC
MIKSRAMFCPKCGKQNDDRATFCQSCGMAIQSQPAGSVAATGVTVYAGFWTRFLAMVIDLIVVSLMGGLLAAGSFGIGVVISFFIPWLYEAFMLSSEWQATVGKRAMSIVVTGTNGGRISFARATGRHFAKILSGAIIFIGFIMAAFTARKQALHDMLAETLVVRR